MITSVATPAIIQKIMFLLFFFLVKTFLVSKVVTVRPPPSKSCKLTPPVAARAGSFLGGEGAAGADEEGADEAAGAPGT